MATKAPPISDGIVKTLLWQEIIRSAFSPVTKSEQLSWLQNYYYSLRNIWGIVESNWKISLSNHIIHSSYNIQIDYSLEDVKKTSIVLHLKQIGLKLYHDADCSFFCPKDTLNFAFTNDRKTALNFFQGTSLNM